MIYPLASADGMFDEYSQKLVGRDVDADAEGYSVMWSTTRDGIFGENCAVDLNHFVALIKHDHQPSPFTRGAETRTGKR